MLNKNQFSYYKKYVKSMQIGASICIFFLKLVINKWYIKGYFVIIVPLWPLHNENGTIEQFQIFSE